MANTSPSRASLFDGIQTLVGEVLGAPTKNRGIFETRKPTEADGALVVNAAYGVLSKRFESTLHRQSRSKQNWRTIPQLAEWVAEKHEVDLERRLVKARKKGDWWNQMPVASGLVDSKLDHALRIDLAHSRGPGSYAFVELKIDSDNPVYAAVEIVLYGIAWLLSRYHRESLYRGRILAPLEGKNVGLYVLAPRRFYRNFQRDAFQTGLDTAIRDLASRPEFDVEMSFRFLEFPKKFDELKKDYDASVLRDVLDGLFPSKQ